MARPLDREISYPDNRAIALGVVTMVLESSAREYGATGLFVEIDGERREISAILFESEGKSVTLIGAKKSA